MERRASNAGDEGCRTSGLSRPSSTWGYRGGVEDNTHGDSPFHLGLLESQATQRDQHGQMLVVVEPIVFCVGADL
jgi:hypothetical protein